MADTYPGYVNPYDLANKSVVTNPALSPGRAANATVPTNASSPILSGQGFSSDPGMAAANTSGVRETRPVSRSVSLGDLAYRGTTGLTKQTNLPQDLAGTSANLAPGKLSTAQKLAQMGDLRLSAAGYGVNLASNAPADSSDSLSSPGARVSSGLQNNELLSAVDSLRYGTTQRDIDVNAARNQPGGSNFSAANNRNVSRATAATAANRASASGFQFSDVGVGTSRPLTGSAQRSEISTNVFTNSDNAFSQYFTSERPQAQFQTVGDQRVFTGFAGTTGNKQLDGLFQDLETAKMNRDTGTLSTSAYNAKESAIMDQISNLQTQIIDSAVPGFSDDINFQRQLATEAASNAAINSVAGFSQNVEDFIDSLGYNEEISSLRSEAQKEIDALEAAKNDEEVDANDRILTLKRNQANRLDQFRRLEAVRDPVTGELTKQSQDALLEIENSFNERIDKEKDTIRTEIDDKIDKISTTYDKDVRALRTSERAARLSFMNTQQSQQFQLMRDENTEQRAIEGEQRRAIIEVKKQEMIKQMGKDSVSDAEDQLAALIKGRSPEELMALRTSIIRNAVLTGSTQEEAESRYDVLLDGAQKSADMQQQLDEALIRNRDRSFTAIYANPFDQISGQNKEEAYNQAARFPQEEVVQQDDFSNMSNEDLLRLVNAGSEDPLINFVLNGNNFR